MAEIDNDMNKMPAIPPNDYHGSVADWHVALIKRGLWDGKNPIWHGDVEITTDEWWEILEECEGKYHN